MPRRTLLALTAIAFTLFALAAAVTDVSPVARLLAQPEADVLERRFSRVPNANAATCNPRGDADVKACLVPGSDALADQSKRVAPGVDCFWRKDDTKRFEDVAGNSGGAGSAVRFRFIVANRCAVPVQVQLTLSAPEGNALRFRDCEATVFTQTLAPGARPFVQTCMSLPYRAGSQTFTRSFSIGGRAPGAGPFVLFDPEVVIEEAAAP